jgi:hypothetical protein
MTGMPASLAFCTSVAMVLEFSASTRMTSTLSSIICWNCRLCLATLASALA